jgi:iron complex transport system substrate-binding protein
VLVAALLVASLAAQTPAPARRIVSLVPALTEMAFAIGAGEAVVGVSSFDRYPREVGTRTRVGALLDPDLERILSLRPDLVLAYDSQTALRQQLERAGIRVFDYRHGGLGDVLATLGRLGEVTGHQGAAAAIATRIEGELAEVRRRVAARPRPRVLLVIGREPGALRNIYASGGRGFLHDMLTAAGGDNVFADVGRESVQATTELILARRPDVIVELRSRPLTGTSTMEREQRTWQALGAVPAVARGRVHLVEGDDLVVPGPRVGTSTGRLARLLHPEAFR